jgi:hypothetical protein
MVNNSETDWIYVAKTVGSLVILFPCLKNRTRGRPRVRFFKKVVIYLTICHVQHFELATGTQTD